jgi:signal transduction histidine kinase
MQLSARTLVTGLVIAVPVAIVAAWAADRIRARDLELSLARVVRSQVNAQVRERCESDPRWFLTGPLDGRPRPGTPVDPDPDALPPRPKVAPQPFELFAYDETFGGSSPAAPRFPTDLRHRLLAAMPEAFAPYETAGGTGVQMAVPTGWIGGPCMYFLGRMEPPPDQASLSRRVLVAAYVIALAAALAAAAPMVLRVRRLSRQAREAKDDGYATLALDARKDELNVVTFVYNDAVNELRARKARIEDLEAALRRLVQSTDEDIARPLRALENALGRSDASAGGSDDRSALHQAHDAAMRVENLTAAATLRMAGGPGPGALIDLNALVERVVTRFEPIARSARVSISKAMPAERLTMEGHEALVELALSNLVDNAVRYNTPGGTVTVALRRDASSGRFHLRITDTGRGVSAEDFKTLTAVRRFRGDEHRNRRPGAPGLGLAVAREVGDRSGLHLELTQPAGGGFEAEFSGPLRRA